MPTPNTPGMTPADLEAIEDFQRDLWAALVGTTAKIDTVAAWEKWLAIKAARLHSQPSQAPATDLEAALEALEDAITHTNNRGQGWEINGEKAVLVPYIELRSVMDRAAAPATPRKPSPAAVVIAQAIDQASPRADEHDLASYVIDALEGAGYRIIHEVNRAPATPIERAAREALEPFAAKYKEMKPRFQNREISDLMVPFAWLERAHASLSSLPQDPAPLNLGPWGVNERRDALNILRQVCAVHGDNDFADDLHLGDAIEKHLWRHLEAQDPAAGEGGQP